MGKLDNIKNESVSKGNRRFAFAYLYSASSKKI